MDNITQPEKEDAQNKTYDQMNRPMICLYALSSPWNIDSM